MKLLGDFYTICINAFCLGKKFWQCAVMREGQKKWGLKTFQNIQFCTAEEEMKHCEYEYAHTNIHTHKHRLRPANTQLKHRTLPHPHCKQKCLNTPPVLPGFICTSLLVWKLLVYSHYQDQPNKARKHGQDCFREFSCIYFSHRSFKMSNLTAQIRNRIKMPLDIHTSHVTHFCTPEKE